MLDGLTQSSGESDCDRRLFCRVFKSIIDKRPFTTTRAGFEIWRNLVMSIGFGHKFGIDLPGELNGNIPSSNYYDRYHGKKPLDLYGDHFPGHRPG